MEKKVYIKAFFSQRFLAFLLDLIIVSLFTSLVVSFIPKSDTLNKLYSEENRVIENYFNGDISLDEYFNNLVDISYDISRQTVISSLVAIFITIIYYVIYPCYNNGQTLGKKLFKIRIKKVDDGNLTMNDLLIRSMINNSILLSIINVCLVMFLAKDLYLASSSLVTLGQYLVMVISIIMIAFTKRAQGLHDKVVHTEVVMTNAVREEKLCQEEI